MQVMLDGNKLAVNFGHYSNNGRKSIQLVDLETGEPYVTASINLTDDDLSDNEIAIKDYSENKGTLKALMNAGIVSKPLRYVEAGFAKVPICKVLKFEDDD